jgi:hypothetical protein
MGRVRRAPATTISEEMAFGRPPFLKVFVSSRMNGSLDDERAAAIEEIGSFPVVEPWAWERSAYAGAYCAVAVCVGEARTSDVLILILGRDLSDITEREYRAAAAARVNCIILVKEGVRRVRAAREFLESEQRGRVITVNFANLSELRTHINDSIKFHFVSSSREAQMARQAATARSRLTVGGIFRRGR